MRIASSEKSLFGDNGFFSLKDNGWLEKQRVAGKVAAATLMLLEGLVKEKTSLSLIELNKLAEEYILDNECIPTFKNYKGHGLTPFPAGVCISVNEQLVHGIPTSYQLKDGDVISFDLGTTYQGVIADTALTCLYGEPKKQEHLKLIEATNEALMKGIAAIKVGDKLGVIGHAINKSAKGNGFNVITQYGGHGIDISPKGIGIPHAPPFVSNKEVPENGFRIQPGLVIAIEPMLVTRDTSTRLHGDGWTVLTKEIGAHAEHSVFVHEDHVEIITERNYA